MLECLCCGEELTWHDYYGKRKVAEHYYSSPQSWIEKEGDIYKCENENCESYEGHFYTDSQDNLYEGYPC